MKALNQLKQPKKVMLDTCVWIQAIRKPKLLEQLIKKYSDCELVSSVLIYAEIKTGLYRFLNNDKQFQITEAIFALQNTFLDVDIVVSDEAALIYAKLRSQGLGHNNLVSDYYLAATCTLNDITFVTLNSKDFVKISGLELELLDY